MRNINKIVRNSFHSGYNFRLELNAFLRSYRSTPHSSTNAAPADLLFKRPNHCRLPRYQAKCEPEPEMVEAQARDAESKAKMKHYGDKRRNAKPHSFAAGEFVLLDQTKGKKIWSKKQHLYDSGPLVVTATKGSMVTVMARNGREIVRDASWFKRCTSDALIKSPLEVEPELQANRNQVPMAQDPVPATDPQETGDQDPQQGPSNDSFASNTAPSPPAATETYAGVTSRPSLATNRATPRLAQPSPNQATHQQQRRTARAPKPVDRFEVKHAARGQGLRKIQKSPGDVMCGQVDVTISTCHSHSLVYFIYFYCI
jgi:hypothetical protein